MVTRLRLFSYLALSFIFWGQVLYGDTNLDKHSKTIKRIRKLYQLTEKNLSAYKKIEKNAPFESTEGGVLLGYFKQGRLMKIKSIYYGEIGKHEAHFYFDKSKNLYFVFSQDFRYDKHIMEGKVKVINVKANRYYFDKDHLFRWLEGKNKKLILDKDKIKKETKELIEESNVYLKVFGVKNKKK